MEARSLNDDKGCLSLGQERIPFCRIVPTVIESSSGERHVWDVRLRNSLLAWILYTNAGRPESRRTSSKGGGVSFRTPFLIDPIVRLPTLC